MGLFSRKKRFPEPSVSVQLDQASGSLYTPNEVISGTISLESSVSRHIRFVEIALVGRAITHNTRSQSNGVNAVQNQRTKTIHYHDEIELFRLSQQLPFQINPVAQNCPYTWRFQFLFPDNTADVIGVIPYTGRTTKTDIYASTGHPLPPSFLYEASTNAYARVQYNLETVVSFEDEDEPFITPSPPLNYTPARPTLSAGFVEAIMPLKNYSSSRLIGGEKSLMHSFRDKFSSQTPSVRVGLKASMPSMIPVGRQFAFYGCVEIDSISLSSISIPSVEFRIESLKLIPVTFYRALRVRGFGIHDEHERTDEESVRLNAVPERVTTQQQLLGKEKLTFPATFEARVPGDVAPSFRTFNINRAYQFVAKIEVDVCGKTFDLKLEATVDLVSAVGQ